MKTIKSTVQRGTVAADCHFTQNGPEGSPKERTTQWGDHPESKYSGDRQEQRTQAEAGCAGHHRTRKAIQVPDSSFNPSGCWVVSSGLENESG